MARIELTKWERNDIERLRDSYLAALADYCKDHEVAEEDVDNLLVHGEMIACEGYMEAEQKDVP